MEKIDGTNSELQLKIGEDIDEVREEVKIEREKEEAIERELERKEKEFKANYKYGSTTCFKRNDKYYFLGDISHCGKEAIFFNAKKIISEMKKKGCSYGHMSYNDLPTFKNSYDYERIKEIDIERYKHKVFEEGDLK
ncbi:MAG: hypothetical protein WD512_03220 [Candidatus Paceibacterota bacterium]